MDTDIQEIIESRRHEKYSLYAQYINPKEVESTKRIGADIDYTRAEGPYLYSQAGERYLDCDAGSGVFCLGRNHPKLLHALQNALGLGLPSMVYRDTPLLAGLLAEALAKKTPGDLNKALFTNSGSETTEAAIKFARILTGKSKLLYCEGDFHGSTYGALSITDLDVVRMGFGPMLSDCQRIPRNNLETLQKALEKGDVAGLFVEPLQGVDARQLDDDFLLGARQLCQEYNAVFIVDEVFLGFGRTGNFFYCDHLNLKPDALILSKALSGGYAPVGALMMRDELYEQLLQRPAPLLHGSTFGGNEFGMIAALATLQTLEEENLVANANAMGAKLRAGLTDLKERYDIIADVRGAGLFIGLELKAPGPLTLRVSGELLKRRGLLAHLIVMQLLEKHRILCATVIRNNILRLTPPLVISEDDVNYFLNALESVFKDTYRFPDGISRYVISQLVKMTKG